MQFKSRGEITRLGVDELNERMEVKGPLRLRHSMCPDEGYGVVMCWDGVVCDTQALRKQAWRNVADQRGARFPEALPQSVRSRVALGAHATLRSVHGTHLGWTHIRALHSI